MGYTELFAISLFVLLSLKVHSDIFLIYFISAAVILLASLALMVQFSLPYNKSERVGISHNFILVFLNVFVI